MKRRCVWGRMEKRNWVWEMDIWGNGGFPLLFNIATAHRWPGMLASLELFQGFQPSKTSRWETENWLADVIWIWQRVYLPLPWWHHNGGTTIVAPKWWRRWWWNCDACFNTQLITNLKISHTTSLSLDKELPTCKHYVHQGWPMKCG